MKSISEMLKRNQILAVTLSLAMVFVLSSCEDDDENIEPVDVAYVALYNASPNSPDLDIIVDTRDVNVYPFEYTDYTGYLRFFTGDRNLQFGPFDASNVVEDTIVNFENANAYSVFVVDEYPNIDALILDDDADNPAAGNAMIRFVHLSPDAPSVDLAMEGEADAMFADQSFKNATDFTEISAEEYDFEVRANSDDEVLLTVPDINIEPGWFYTIIVRGYANPDDGSTSVLSADVIVS